MPPLLLGSSVKDLPKREKRRDNPIERTFESDILRGASFNADTTVGDDANDKLAVLLILLANVGVLITTSD